MVPLVVIVPVAFFMVALGPFKVPVTHVEFNPSQLSFPLEPLTYMESPEAAATLPTPYEKITNKPIKTIPKIARLFNRDIFCFCIFSPPLCRIKKFLNLRINFVIVIY
jgi:hypothetical protein